MVVGLPGSTVFEISYTVSLLRRRVYKLVCCHRGNSYSDRKEAKSSGITRSYINMILKTYPAYHRNLSCLVC
jgi:hypothetical protein